MRVSFDRPCAPAVSVYLDEVRDDDKDDLDGVMSHRPLIGRGNLSWLA